MYESSPKAARFAHAGMLPRMPESSVPAMAAPPRGKDNPLTRSLAGVIGFFVLGALVLACLGSLPWTMTAAGPDEPARFRAGDLDNHLLPPSWWGGLVGLSNRLQPGTAPDFRFPDPKS